jgi:hypothetical protein
VLKRSGPDRDSRRNIKSTNGKQIRADSQRRIIAGGSEISQKQHKEEQAMMAEIAVAKLRMEQDAIMK